MRWDGQRGATTSTPSPSYPHFRAPEPAGRHWYRPSSRRPPGAGEAVLALTLTLTEASWPVDASAAFPCAWRDTKGHASAGVCTRICGMRDMGWDWPLSAWIIAVRSSYLR